MDKEQQEQLEAATTAARRIDLTLLATTDVEIWASEFCRIFKGHVIFPTEEHVGGKVVDEGTMIGWFANLAETVKVKYERELMARLATENVTDEEKEAFIAGFKEGRPEV
jgi:hypothetical protein